MRFLATLLVGLWAGAANAQQSCYPDYTALHSFEKLGSGPTPYSYILKAADGDATKVFFDANYTGGNESQLEMSVHFDKKFDGVSLPYNIYGVMVLRAGEVVSWLDYTQECTSPGIGFFPGQIVSLPTLKLGRAEGSTLQIVVWGGI